MKTAVAALFACLFLPGMARTGESSPGVQVWNCEPWQTVSVGDFSGANPEMKALKPIALLAPRDGAASGFVAVTSGSPITGLKAGVGDLVQAGGKGRIAADQVRVRFADLATPDTSWLPAYRFDRLLEKPPAEVPVVDPAKLAWRFKPKSPAPAATQPVWVTVRVPKDAAPGDYEGTLSIEAAGLAPSPVVVPIKLKVFDWTMPPLVERRVRTLGWLSPENVGKYYKVPLWSDKHFELMERSMELMAELGSRQIHVNVVRRYPAQNNDDTMIKWVKQPDGSFKYDFTVFDKYCDLAEKKLGKPFPVRLNIWRGPTGAEAAKSPDTYAQPKVLVLDPATGQTSELEPPNKLGAEECLAFWKPVLLEIRARIDKRGWADVAGLNWMQYAGDPPKPLVSMVRSIWPDLRWSQTVHGKSFFFPGVGHPGNREDSMGLISQCTVWSQGSLDPYLKWKDGPYPRNYAPGAKTNWTDRYKFNPNSAFCAHARAAYLDHFGPELWKVRTLHEHFIILGNDGLDTVGADFFPVGKDGRGRYRGEDYEWAAQGPHQATKAILGAGPEGPVGTERFEAMREGIQLCEAMVFLHLVQASGKIAGDLAIRANQAIDDRPKAFIAHYSAAIDRAKGIWPHLKNASYAKDARERDGKLYAMAAEVAAKLGPGR